MKFGIRYCNTGKYVEAPKAIELVQAAEAAGFESAWTVDHVVVPEGYQSSYPYSEDGKMAGGVNNIPLPDPLIWMAFVASATSKIKFATGILILPQRNPVVIAKQVATLDRLSQGRIILGVGVGWLEEEFNALGTEFSNRGKRADEYISAMRELWSSDKPSFQGEFVQFKAAHCQPQPIHGSVPIIIGGDSKFAARRAGRLGDGYFPARGASPELFALARKTAVENHRDPNALEFTVSLPNNLDEIPALAEAGVTRVLVPVAPTFGMGHMISQPDDLEDWRPIIEKYAEV